MKVVMAAALLCVGVFVYSAVSLLLGGGDRGMQNRLEQIRLMGVELSPEEELMSRSFSSRFLKPMFVNLVSRLGRVIPVKEKDRERISLMMTQAGLRLSPGEYIAIQILSVAGGGVLGLYFSLTASLPMYICLFFGIYAGFTLFRFTMTGRVKKRKEKIEEQIPEVLDLLSVSVEAGLGFNQAMMYVSEQCRGALIDEFTEAQKEIALGRSRRTALMNMARRCGLEEVQTFVSAVVQADELGISLKNILSSQAEEMRALRKMKIEEKAQKIPIKILLPMVFFIFPVIFIILMGPIVPKIMEAVSGGI